ncbi:MAG: hypothetical protein WCT36_02310 [Candidatus Gracilibacteria bacterium]
MKLSQVILLSGLALGGAAGCYESDEVIRQKCPEVRFKCDGENTEGCGEAINECFKNDDDYLVNETIKMLKKDILLLLICFFSGGAVTQALMLHKGKEK